MLFSYFVASIYTRFKMSTDIENYIFDLSRELNIENTHGVFGNELELIALVRNCPYLYDKSRTDFKDFQKKEMTWGAIATIMHCAVNDCKARWKSLREQYAKIKKAMLTNDADSSRLFQWEYMDDMKFLDDHIKPRRIKRKFRRDFLGVDQQTLEQEEEYRIEWLDDGKNYESREIKLINLVKSCPLLYNKNNFDHKDPIKKEQAWASIAKILGTPALDCKTRWKTMRERYARERKWQNEDPSRKPWTFFEEMSFLDAHVRARRSSFRAILPKPDYTAFIKGSDTNLVSNSGLPSDHNNSTHFQIQKLEFIDPGYQGCGTVGTTDPNPIAMSPNSVRSQSNSDTSKVEKSEAMTPHTSVTSQDEDDLFGQSIAAELKRITGRRKKMRLKANIFKLLCDAAESDTN